MKKWIISTTLLLSGVGSFLVFAANIGKSLELKNWIPLLASQLWFMYFMLNELKPNK